MCEVRLYLLNGKEHPYVFKIRRYEHRTAVNAADDSD